jgi:hypothetical protein
MPKTDRVSGTGVVDTASAAAMPLVAALQGLSRAYQKTTIYPTGHPAVTEALTLAADGFEAALRENDPIVALIARDHFMIADQPLAEASDALTSLAGMLFELDIAALEFHGGLTIAALEQFIRALGTAKRDGTKGVALVETLTNGGGRSVKARAINYDALRFSEGRRDPDEQQPDCDVWENVSRILADPEPALDRLSPEELAEEVSQEIQEQEGTGVGLLKKRIHRLNRNSRALELPKRKEIQRRVSAFVTSLSPKLRRDLLRVDPEMPEESIELMSDVVDQLPDSDLLRTLQELDHIGARVPDQLLTLLNKLVRISNKRPSLAADLQERLSRWGIPPATMAGSPESLQSALEEVFQKRARSDFIPQTHRTLLDNLSRQTIDVGEFSFDDRYRDPRDSHSVRLQASEIAARLLRGNSGEHHRAGIFAFLASAADSLIERGRFEVIRDAAISARTYSMLKSESEENRRAADGFLEEFRSDRRISLLLEHGCSENGCDEAALALLSLGGQPALEGVLDLLANGVPEAAAGDLASFAKGRNMQALARAVSARIPRGWQALSPILDLLGEMPADDAIPLLEKLYSHEECRVRRHALRLLCRLDERPGSPMRHLVRGLRDASSRVSAVALRRLVDMKTDDSSDLLCDYLEGEFNGLPPSPGYARLAANGLLDRGDYALSHLCLSLNRLRKALNPRKVLVAGIIAEALQSRQDDSLARRCLRSWKFSPSRMIALLIPDARKSGRKRSR